MHYQLVRSLGGDPEDSGTVSAALHRGWMDIKALVTGNDLKEMGLEPGPLFKVLLDRVREAQLDGSIRTPEEGQALVRETLPKP